MVPGTQLDRGYLRKELQPDLCQTQRLFPLPVGAVILRDVRTMHGGSPNLAENIRFLPAIEFASQKFLQTARGRQFIRKSSMPRSLFEKLRPPTQRRVHPDVVAESKVCVKFSKC